MNYEERYNQAIEAAKSELHCCGSLDCDAARQIFRLFPELKESEDERIRKEIIAYLDVQDAISNRKDRDFKDWIAWLEKQGEIIDLQEYAKGILKGAAIHLMIWIDENLADGNMCLSNMECEDLADAMVNAKWDKIYNYIKKKVEKQGEQPSWSKEDEEMLDRIIDCIDGTGLLDFCQIDWLKSIKNRVQPKQEWSEEDEKIRKDLITYINSIKGDTLDLNMRAHEWLCWLEKQKEKKQIIAVDSDQLLKILPRTVEWSEEDEEMIDFMIKFIESLWWRKDLTQRKDNVLSWLKSLKSKKHWKPSEEQMEALKKRTHGLHESSETRKALESLINDLEKL